MKLSTRPATLAEAEAVDNIDDDDDDESDGNEDDDDDDGEEGGTDGSSTVLPTFDVPYLRFIDEEEVDDFGGEGRSDCGVAVGVGGGWCVADECCGGAWSCRYVVVSGTPLKILEHLLSDLRLDEQRGAPESRDSGE